MIALECELLAERLRQSPEAQNILASDDQDSERALLQPT